ncbi:MAG TPA: PIG-L family deacetylase [Solirubrobacteraceae bacterium]|jgi:LmbE family N-acetylglucosaminyl deacetylase
MDPDVVILSPHFDDAVLSCWHVLRGAGEVLVVNVFTGEPPAGTLGWWDQLAGVTDSAAAVRARAQEDRAALALAGRAALNLPFLDGQYRQRDQSPGEIVEALRRLRVTGARIYAPAGLGDCHRDHAAVRDAALELHTQGADVVLYADLPHANKYGWPRWVLGGATAGTDPAGEQWASQLQAGGIRVERTTAATYPLAPEDYAEKLAAVRAYRSQIAPLQQDFATSLEDPRVLGFEVDWLL